MGLAGAKNRQKLSADPNNTNWSRDTDRFGHKILTSQGWTPGQYLGAKDASHAAHYSAANASHIRVAVKDDNLGLGAKRGKAENDTFGLSLFQGVLGRLNGKSDVELKKEESTQRDMKLALYQGQRWGMMNFVHGGFLVGDKIENLKKLENGTASSKEAEKAGDVEESQKSERSGGKRKRSGSSESSESSDTPSLKRKKRKSNLQAEFESGKIDISAEKKKHNKSNKTTEDGGEDSKAVGSASISSDEKAEKKRRKAEKKARKEAKKEKKAAKLEKKAKKESKRRDKEQRKQEKARKADSSSDSSSDSETEAAASKPAAPAVAPANFGGSRLAVRQRYIRQKKMASMDPQALKEIFMVKAEA